MSRRLLAAVAVLAVFLVAVPATGAQQSHLDPEFLESIDDAVIHGTVTPPGADTRHATAEVPAYDDLVQGYPNLTEEELRTRYFKDRRFGEVEDPQRSYTPRAGVTVVRDAKWGQPHIFGDTDADMAFGAGYVAAEDRLAIMELLRALGRAEAFQLLETTPAWLADGEMVRMYGYTEEEFQAQIDRLPEVYGQVGADAKQLLIDYVKGINAYLTDAARGEVPLPTGLAELGIEAPAPYRPTDVVAVTSAVRALFGAGGGSEVNNAAVFAGLVEDFGPTKGRSIYDDFRNRFNADGPLHTTKRFPYLQRKAAKLDPDANVFGYNGGKTGFQVLLEDLFSGDIGLAATQLRQLAAASRIKWEHLKLDTPLGAVDLSRPNSMSNHLIVGRERSATGSPILLGGPQAAYFQPEILMDYELHSPTIHARGAGFPGLSTLVIMGRTQNYAWTPTAGGSDMIDHYVEKLCEPNGSEPDERSYHYEFKGECLEMDRRVIRTVEEDAPADLPGRELLPDIIAERTVHGPVVARGMVGETPVAISMKRSTYMKEVDAAVSILKMNRNEVRTPEQFVEVFHESHNLSTNWGYVNDRDIAYVHGGLYPMRPDTIDPDFPVWGTGEWEWKTDADGNDVYLPSRRVPHEVNPERDWVVSWNNRTAPGWGSADSQWGYSSLYRADMLIDGIEAQPPKSIDLVKLTQIMEEAGLTDLRGRYVAPLAVRILKRQAAPTDREQEMIELLEDWIDAQALRRDGDADGEYDHAAAVAIMDAWWERLLRAVFDPTLGDAARIPLGFDNAPSMQGSAYQGGFYGYVWTQLAMALGDDVESPTSRLYCGGDADTNGTLDTCTDKIWESFVAAGDALAEDQDSDDPSEWGVDEEGERIRFLPNVALSMHWVNRPTTQQLAMFGARRAQQVPGHGDPGRDGTLPATGGGILGGLVLLLTGAGFVSLRRRQQPLRD